MARIEKFQKAQPSEILAAAGETLSHYPKAWQDRQYNRLTQFAEEISLIYRPGGTVVDLGGGDGLRSAICCRLGMRAVSVDEYHLVAEKHDYLPTGFLEQHKAAGRVSQQLGVEFVHHEVGSWQCDLADIDVVMSFDAMEHFHHSPRTVFAQLFTRLKPGGLFLLGVPNAANLLKRFRVLFGGNAFSRMEDWYFQHYFAGHVREPITKDLYVIAKDLGLSATVFGMNWLGLRRVGRNSKLAWVLDKSLQLVPSFCSDIYLYGEKPS